MYYECSRTIMTSACHRRNSAAATFYFNKFNPPQGVSCVVAGDASLSAGSAQAEARAASLAGLAGSLGGQDAASPAAHRLEVTVDVFRAFASDTASAASWPDDLPSTSISSAARLRNLFLYGAPQPPPDPEAGGVEPRPDTPPTS